MKNVLVYVGKSPQTYKFAIHLIQEGFNVSVVVDNPAEAKIFLGEEFMGKVERTPHHGISMNTLQRAGIENAEMVLGLTGSERENILCAEIARVIYNKQKEQVICLLDDLKLADFYKDKWTVHINLHEVRELL